MKIASYIFREVKFAGRDQIQFFQDCLIATPCIGSHVQKISVNTAALLRSVNQTSIKATCHNVKEIQILVDQGRGSWAQHLIPYSHIQHPPTLLDTTNANIVLNLYRHQIMTLRLGGKYLYSLSLQNIEDLVKTTPQIRTFGLHYLFKEKNKDIHCDLPHTLTFENLNSLLKQPNSMTRFELQYCEVADTSLIAPNTADSDLLRQLRASRDTPVIYDFSLLNTNNTLTHIEMKFVQVTNLSHFVRSILDSFTNLQVLDLTFVPRNKNLEISVGSQWDLPQAELWTRDFPQVPSRLKKLALTKTHSRLTVSELLTALARARAPLQEISIIDSNDREASSMDIICGNFTNTLQSLIMDCKTAFGLDGIGSLFRLKSAKLHWAHSHVEMPVNPGKLLHSAPSLTELELGYNQWYSHMIARPLDFTHEPYANITKLTLDRIIINENEMKEVMLPLINLKEAIFRKCMFESSKAEEEMADNWAPCLDATIPEVDEPTELDKEEMFDFMPSSGALVDEVRQNLFKSKVTDLSNNVDKASNNMAQSSTDSAVAVAEEERTALSDPTVNRAAMLMARPMNRNRPVNDPSKSKKNNFHIQSLSLEHLGLHDCKFREVSGGMANARTIRNFEVIQDRRSGCVKSYDIDRAYHEKKSCNPHVILNKKTVTDETIGFHYTHEFGGTTGKNDYVNSRPTFKIRLFSLEKLSIRPNCLMSIYFTDAKGGRLKTCDSIVKEQVAFSEANDGTYTLPESPLPEISNVEDNRRYAKELMDMYTNDMAQKTPTPIASSTKRQNQEVEQVSQFITRAMDTRPGGRSRRFMDETYGVDMTGNFFDRIRGISNYFDDDDMDDIASWGGDFDNDPELRQFDTAIRNNVRGSLTTLGGVTGSLLNNSRTEIPASNATATNETASNTTEFNETEPNATSSTATVSTKTASNTTEETPVFNKYLFDSDIFKSVVYDSCEFSRNHRPSLPKAGKNRKTMNIRPF